MPLDTQKEFLKRLAYASIADGAIIGGVSLYVLCVHSSEVAGSLLLASFVFIVVASCSWTSYNKGVQHCFFLWVLLLLVAAVLAFAGGIVLVENNSIGNGKDGERRVSEAAVIFGALSAFFLPLMFISFLCEYGYRKQKEESELQLLLNV